MDYVHQRYLQHFVEQDMVGHMEVDLDERAELGRVRVAIAFADLAGYTRFTEEAGEEEAFSTVERFIDAVSDTLPDDARVLKTIGDEVMLVGQDVQALTDWAVGFQRLYRDRPMPRIGVHVGVTLYRDGDYFGREVNLAARVVARARGGEVVVTDTVMEQIKTSAWLRFTTSARSSSRASTSRARSTGRRSRMTIDSRALDGSARERADPPGRAAARDGLRRAPTRSACWTWRCGWRRGAARCTSNYGLRGAESGRRRAAAAAELCERLGVDLAPSGSSCRGRATCRRGRASCPLRRGRSAARELTTRRRTPPPTRSRRSSTGSPPRPGGARCSACSRAAGAWSGRCSSVTRDAHRRLLRRARARPGARTHPTPTPATRARASATG